MKSLQEIRAILLRCFYGGVFIAQMIGWLIINYIGAFGKPLWCIICTAVVMTFITCSLYLLLRKLYQKVKGVEEPSVAEEIYELSRAD